MQILKGLPSAPGIGGGPAHLVIHGELKAARHPAEDSEHELARFEEALNAAEIDLKALATHSKSAVGKQEAAIFEAHRVMLRDPELHKRVRQTVQQDKVNVEHAWQEAIDFHAGMLRRLDDPYLAARGADIENVGRRVLAILMGECQESRALEQPSIIVADDLTPADTVQFDRSLVRGFCTRTGGPTAHAAILAKALGVPCVAGLSADLTEISNGTYLFVDGNKGEVLIDPDGPTRARYEAMAELQTAERLDTLRGAGKPAITRDGKHIEVVANVGSVADAIDAVKHGAEGIGLLRTEFLFLERPDAPSELEQVQTYLQIFRAIGESKPIVVRTLDIGGDKPARYLELPKEANPFLGIRGLRLSLRFAELFETQLRALLIAGRGYDLRIMFPMVASIEELRQAHEAVERCKAALRAQGRDFSETPQVGIMVEVPSAAIMADALAKEVDFFSIGTNDLSQYTLAAERTSPTVAYLADPLHPAVIRLIRQVINAAHACGKWVGVCGEMAGDPLAVPILLGLGLDEFSASATLIPRVKQTLAAFSCEEARQVADKALACSHAAEVLQLMTGVQHEKMHADRGVPPAAA